MKAIFNTILGTFFLFLVTLTSAMSQDFYDHNGSIMRLEQNGKTISIFYHKPREGLKGVGVQPGSLLFRGQLDNTNYLDGMSRIFSSRCGEIDYFVYGDFRPGQRLLLRGASPVLAKDSCRIIDNRSEGANANLLFIPIVNRPQQNEQVRRAQGGLACVTNVRSGSTLNMRVGPATRYGIVAEVPYDACGLLIGQTCIGNWCGVRHRDNVGWVNTKFLKRR